MFLFVETLMNKLELLEMLKPKTLDDFAPLLVLKTDALKKLIHRLTKEEDMIEQKNRIYFLSEKLKVI